MNAKRRGLGRGLDALLGGLTGATSTTGSEVAAGTLGSLRRGCAR